MPGWGGHKVNAGCGGWYSKRRMWGGHIIYACTRDGDIIHARWGVYIVSAGPRRTYNLRPLNTLTNACGPANIIPPPPRKPLYMLHVYPNLFFSVFFFSTSLFLPPSKQHLYLSLPFSNAVTSRKGRKKRKIASR